MKRSREEISSSSGGDLKNSAGTEESPAKEAKTSSGSNDEKHAAAVADTSSNTDRKRSTDAAIPSGSSGASTSSTAATAKKAAASEARGGAGGSAAKTSMSSASKPDAKQGGAGKAPGGDADEREVEGVPNETLFVGNLSYKVSEAVIIKLFTPFGKIVREQFCYHMTGPRRGEPRGFCFVEYSNAEDAGKAIKALHGRKLYGRPLRVRFMTVEGQGRMDYSMSDTSKSGASTGGYEDSSGGAKIPLANATGGGSGAAPAGVTKLSIDKKVALLKLKLREAGKSGT